jgi:hypothetical protein
MPGEHGRRLVELLYARRLVDVQGSDTLIPLDQPTKFAEVIREFALASEATYRSSAARSRRQLSPVAQ